MDQILSLLNVFLATTVIYLFVVFALSLAGHRQTSEIGILELVIIALLGSAVETSMVTGNTSLLAGLVSAGTLMFWNRMISMAVHRWVRLRHLLIGRPIPLVYKGQLLRDCLRQAGLTDDDVMEGIRERGYGELPQVRLAVLETDGEISVVPYDQNIA